MKIYICSDDVNQKKQLESIIHNIMKHKSTQYSLIHLNVETDSLDYMKKLDKLGVYILNADKGADNHLIKLAKDIRKYDARGFLIFLTKDMLIIEKIFNEKIEILDLIVSEDQMELNQRLEACFNNIQEKLDAYHEINKKLYVEDKNTIKVIHYNAINYINRISRNKYCISTNEGDYIYKGYLDFSNKMLSRYVV